VAARGGPAEEEALALLQTARLTPEEGLALDGLVQLSRVRALAPRLTVAAASALIDRGDRAAARALLETTDATASLMVRADLLADAGDVAAAMATIERVLCRDLDVPGARERHTRWRARLGLAERPARVDPATMTVATPRARAPFELLREVARGGAGVVFEARDRELGRTVALKLYHRPDRDRAQLLHEGRVAAALEGPGVVRVFDVEPTEGWLALEWASLGALRDLVRRADTASLVPVDAWLPGLVGALARVHAAGWVHHDVKPANVLMAPGDHGAPVAWLADFGIARRTGEPSPPGSLGFVSPERLAGRPSDARDDVYGLGRVVEDVLAGLGSAADTERWRAAAAACTGPDDTRPRDGAAVLALLDRR